MSGGLSGRMNETLQELMPKLGAAAEAPDPSADMIDLSGADNLLVRNELRNICQSTIQSQWTNEVGLRFHK